MPCSEAVGRAATALGLEGAADCLSTSRQRPRQGQQAAALVAMGTHLSQVSQWGQAPARLAAYQG